MNRLKEPLLLNNFSKAIAYLITGGRIGQKSVITSRGHKEFHYFMDMNKTNEKRMTNNLFEMLLNEEFLIEDEEPNYYVCVLKPKVKMFF
jgi:hypothetical protein